VIYANRPLFISPSGWLPGTILKVAGGVVVTHDDGTVLSVQPNGAFQSRPAGTAGPYEVAEQSGDKLIYRPNGVIYVVATVGA
jgi:hypothetical protein